MFPDCVFAFRNIRLAISLSSNTAVGLQPQTFAHKPAKMSPGCTTPMKRHMVAVAALAAGSLLGSCMGARFTDISLNKFGVYYGSTWDQAKFVGVACACIV